MDPCGFATATYRAYVVGNPAHIFTSKIPNLVRNHLNSEWMVQRRLKTTLSENLAVIKHTPCRLRHRCTRVLCPFYHPSRSSFPPVPQPDSRHTVTNQGVPDPPILGYDTGIARKNEDCVSIRGYLASDLPPSLESRTASATGGRLSKGASRRRRRRLHLRHPLTVQSPRETSVPSDSSRFRSTDSQCYSLKDLVDELRLFSFAHSPIVNLRREVGRSVEYEDLLPLLHRRRMVRGITS